MFRLAGHLHMTVGELSRRMDSRELAEWMAYTKYFEAIGNPGAETGLIVSALLAPHAPKGKAPKPQDFIPIEPAPQHEVQAREVLLDLKRQLGIE